MENENQTSSITGVRIKEMRLNNNLTQKDLAKRLGLKNDTAIANYESGYSIPKDDIKIKMCDLFNCTIDYLMGKSYYKNYEDYQNAEEFTLRNIKNLNEEEVKEVTRLLNYINRNNIKDVDDFINNEISNFNSVSKLTLIRIISHLYYRYHGKIPEDFNSKDIVEQVDTKNTTSINKTSSTQFYMCPVYRTNFSRTT